MLITLERDVYFSTGIDRAIVTDDLWNLYNIIPLRLISYCNGIVIDKSNGELKLKSIDSKKLIMDLSKEVGITIPNEIKIDSTSELGYLIYIAFGLIRDSITETLFNVNLKLYFGM
jgi:hypothetical protein